jgi:hypothetical protein
MACTVAETVCHCALWDNHSVRNIALENLRCLAVDQPNPFGPMVEAIADAVLARLRPALDVQVKQRLFSIDQAAVYLGRTSKAVRCLIDTGAFPTVRTDGRIMLDVRDLDHWIDQGKRQIL